MLTRCFVLAVVIESICAVVALPTLWLVFVLMWEAGKTLRGFAHSNLGDTEPEPEVAGMRERGVSAWRVAAAVAEEGGDY